MAISLDEHGMPVLLADVPNAGVANLDPNQKSGNPRHDVRSGKFGDGGQIKRRTLPVPANVDPTEFHRMLDAVREAAREFDNLDEGDILDFLESRAKNPSAVNVQNFLSLVKEQKLSDLVDILDQNMRGSGIRPSGRRKVKVVAPRGYVKRVLAGLSEDDVAEIVHRLEARGHDPENVDHFLIGKHLKPAKQDAVRQKKAAIHASSQWQADDVELEFVDTVITEQNGYISDDVVELAATLAKNMPQPVINVTVQTPEQKPMKREVLRDEKTGLAIGFKDVPVDE